MKRNDRIGHVSTILALLFALLAIPAQAANWSWIYGGDNVAVDEPQAVQQTSDGGYVAVGWSNSFSGGSGSQILVVKVDADGQLQWARTFGPAGGSHAYAIQQTSDGGYVVAGDTGGNRTAAWVLKLDANGNVQWEKRYTSYDPNGAEESYRARARSIQQTSDGGYILAGEAVTNSGQRRFWVWKIDAAGTLQWQRGYMKNVTDKTGIAFTVQQTSDGGYVVAGYNHFFGSGNSWRPHAWVLKLDGAGQVVWNRELGTDSSRDEVQAIRQTGDGGYILAGWSTATAGAAKDVLVIKLDGDGNTVWTRTWGGPGEDGAHDVVPTVDDGYLVTGFYTHSNTARDVWLLKLNADGELLWQKTYGDPIHSNTGFSGKQTVDGGYIVAATYGVNEQFWLLKLDSTGEVGGECFLRGQPAPEVISGSPELNRGPQQFGTLAGNLRSIDTSDGGSIPEVVTVQQCYFALPQHQLSVSIDPAEGGSVSGSGISCPDQCTVSRDEGTRIDLTALPANGYRFAGWSWDCDLCGNSPACDFILDANRACVASFSLLNEPPQVIAFSADPASGTVPLQVDFTCVANDPDGDILNYLFQFGDGGQAGSGTGVVTHTYANSGRFTANCQACDEAEACSEPAALTIDVRQQQPGWHDISDQLRVSHSPRQLYDRRHRVFFIQVTITNPGADLAGPIRMVITNPSIPVKSGVGVGLDPDGFTEAGDPYFVLVPSGGVLASGQTLNNLRINFELQRKRLTYGIRIEQLY